MAAHRSSSNNQRIHVVLVTVIVVGLSAAWWQWFASGARAQTADHRYLGSFVAPAVTIHPEGSLILQFDSRLQATPPPGFQIVVPPELQEGV